MNKFKVGEDVRVVRRLFDHQLNLDEVYPISYVDEDDCILKYAIQGDDGLEWWLSDEEIEHPSEMEDCYEPLVLPKGYKTSPPKEEIRKFFEILTVDGETFNFQESVEGQLDSIISRFYNKDIATLVIPDDKDFNTGGCIIVKDKITAIKWD